MRVLAHISDLHFGRHDPVAAEALLGALARFAPDIVIVSGDLTQRARRSEFAAARGFLERVASPLLVIPGNHDVAPFWYPLRRFLQPLARFERYVSPERAPLFLDDEVAILGLNTARRSTAKSGRISLAQIAEMRRAFAALPEGRFRVLVTHHPLATPPGTPGGRTGAAGRSEAALAMLRSLGVRLLLSGHHHRARAGAAEDRDEIAEVPPEARSVLLAHAGTAISTRTRDEANSFNLLKVERETVEIALMTREIGAADFAEHRCERFELGRTGWTLVDDRRAGGRPGG
jgi:3',5'-cyclic AMP phosphodiesterase CpdA